MKMYSRYMGCYTDLKLLRLRRYNISLNHCLQYCDERGNSYASLDSASNCYCDMEFNTQLKCDTSCSTCPHDSDELCGKKNSVVIYYILKGK